MMKGYKTIPCTICGKIHDTAANCPAHQAICDDCKEHIKKQLD